MLIRFGTNIDHKRNYEQARRMLINIFGDVSFSEPRYSRDYNAKPSDPDAAIYLNFNCQVSTEKPLQEVAKLLKQAESLMGRTETRKSNGIIDADFDIIAI